MVIAQRAERVGLAILPRQTEQQQLKSIQRTLQSLIQLDTASLWQVVYVLTGRAVQALWSSTNVFGVSATLATLAHRFTCSIRMHISPLCQLITTQPQQTCNAQMQQ